MLAAVQLHAFLNRVVEFLLQAGLYILQPVIDPLLQTVEDDVGCVHVSGLQIVVERKPEFFELFDIGCLEVEAVPVVFIDVQVEHFRRSLIVDLLVIVVELAQKLGNNPT